MCTCIAENYKYYTLVILQSTQLRQSVQCIVFDEYAVCCAMPEFQATVQPRRKRPPKKKERVVVNDDEEDLEIPVLQDVDHGARHVILTVSRQTQWNT